VTAIIDRRNVLALLGLGCAALWSRRAGATLVRGLTLEALAKTSERILIGSALESSSHWENVGDRRRIVTDTRLRVHSLVAGSAPENEVLVRTHGGRVGKVGERVLGEPELELGTECALFLVRSEKVHHVLGMAQGHYPLHRSPGNVRYLRASPRLPELLEPERSAVRRLAGQELGAAEALIRKART
jgi:hypothetical protein